MKYTGNYNLRKPDGTDIIDIEDLNENADIIDSKLKEVADRAADAAPASHVGAGGTAHALATTNSAGFMSAEDRSKLDGIEAGANKYTHPANHSADMITDSTTKKIMTAQERIQLAGLVTSVYKYIHPDAQNPDNMTLGATGGLIKAQTNTSYTTAQLRNVILSPNAANVSAMQNGDIWIQYE